MRECFLSDFGKPFVIEVMLSRVLLLPYLYGNAFIVYSFYFESDTGEAVVHFRSSLHSVSEFFVLDEVYVFDVHTKWEK